LSFTAAGDVLVIGSRAYFIANDFNTFMTLTDSRAIVNETAFITADGRFYVSYNRMPNTGGIRLLDASRIR
jgi:hypothetical protein